MADDEQVTSSQVAERLQALNDWVNRAAIAGKLGQQYGGDRDLYTVFGYPTLIYNNDYLAQYDRQDIARAVIDRPVDATWRGGVTLAETEDREETELEKAWRKMFKDLRLSSHLPRLDRLSALGRYGVLLLGLDDTRQIRDFANPVNQRGKRKLLYVKPFMENDADIVEWNNDPGSERYGQPETYSITIQHPDGKTSQFVRVHHTRVIHVAFDLMESDTYGTPRLKGVFNRLKDLEKIVGGSAEMFWRGARPGYQGKIDDDYQMTPDVEAGLQKQLSEFEHNLRRVLVNEGVELESLAPQVADPTNHVTTQLQMISAETGIPLRILVGSEVGELASSQDRANWLELIMTRRHEEIEPIILEPLLEKGMRYGFLPNTTDKDEVRFQWQDLFSQSEQQKADVGKTRSEALAAYAGTPQASVVVPPREFLQHVLNLPEEAVEQIIQAVENEDELEDEIIRRESERQQRDEGSDRSFAGGLPGGSSGAQGQDEAS